MKVNCLLFKPFINIKLLFTSKLINYCSVHKTMFIFVFKPWYVTKNNIFFIFTRKITLTFP